MAEAWQAGWAAYHDVDVLVGVGDRQHEASGHAAESLVELEVAVRRVVGASDRIEAHLVHGAVAEPE
jgi:hypothetical protein